MMQALAEDLIAFAGSAADIEIVRIAILPEQAAHLESVPSKTTDKRRYDQMLVRARTGHDHEFVPIDPDKTWQAEALDPATLADIVRREILQRMDPDIYQQRLADEEQVRQDVISKLSTLR
jgi:hypothetical protein